MHPHTNDVRGVGVGDAHRGQQACFGTWPNPLAELPFEPGVPHTVNICFLCSQELTRKSEDTDVTVIVWTYGSGGRMVREGEK